MTGTTVTAEEIETAYQRSGNTLGWRLLYSPVAVLDRAEVAFIGLNPGGNFEPPEHPRFAPSAGSAYVDEIWSGAPRGQSPLQRQVRALFAALGKEPETVLAGNLVPFRSPAFKDLKDPGSAKAYGEALWIRILCTAKPSLVIAMGGDAERAMTSVLNAKIRASESLGWGTVQGRRWSYENGILIGLPHLSRFGVITREVSQPGLRALFGNWWGR